MEMRASEPDLEGGGWLAAIRPRTAAISGTVAFWDGADASGARVPGEAGVEHTGAGPAIGRVPDPLAGADETGMSDEGLSVTSVSSSFGRRT